MQQHRQRRSSSASAAAAAAGGGATSPCPPREAGAGAGDGVGSMALGQVSPATGKVEIWRIPYDYLTLHEARGAGSYKSVHRGKFRSHEVRWRGGMDHMCRFTLDPLSAIQCPSSTN